MRIFSLIGSLGAGGAEMLVRNLSLEYAARGHQAHLAYVSEAEAIGADVPFERGFQDALSAGGVSWSALGHAGRRNPLVGAHRLRRAIRDFDPDVIHMHMGYGVLLQVIAMIGRPTVYTHHNIRVTFPKILFRAFDRVVDRYVAICSPCETLLEGLAHRPIVPIPNGVPERFAAAAPARTLPRDPRVLSVGNIYPQKHYENLVAAAALLVPRFAAAGRRLTFEIAGDGPERGAVEAQIARHGLGDHVRLLGTRSDVGALMAKADLLAMSSRFEGMPITLIEAAMSGLPAVATDVGGCRDVVEEGRNGHLVPPEDPAALAEGIQSVLIQDTRYAAYSEQARRIGGRFSIAACADAHLALYGAIVR